MVVDAAGPAFNPSIVDEQPNPEAQKFYDMMHAGKKESWLGNIRHSQLSEVLEC